MEVLMEMPMRRKPGRISVFRLITTNILTYFMLEQKPHNLKK